LPSAVPECPRPALPARAPLAHPLSKVGGRQRFRSLAERGKDEASHLPALT